MRKTVLNLLAVLIVFVSLSIVTEAQVGCDVYPKANITGNVYRYGIVPVNGAVVNVYRMSPYELISTDETGTDGYFKVFGCVGPNNSFLVTAEHWYWGFDSIEFFDLSADESGVEFVLN